MTLAELGPYGAVVGGLALGAIGVPLPEELVLLGGGAVVHRGGAALAPMLAIAALAVFATDLAVFELGRRFGPAMLSRRPARWLLPASQRERVERALARHHTKLIFIARFLPGLRAPAFLILGAHGVPRWRFAAYDGISVLVSVPLMIGIGYLASSSIDRIATDMAHAGHIVVLAIVAAIAVAVIASVIRGHLRRP